AAGDRCTVAVTGGAPGPEELSLESDDGAAYELLLAQAASGGDELRGVIDARALAGRGSGLGEEQLHSVAARALRLTQAIAGTPRDTPAPRLWLLTAATQGAGAAAHAP